MPTLRVMPWYVKFVAVGLAVTVAGAASRRFGPTAGGMLLAFPFAIGSGLIFTIGSGSAMFRATATGALWGLIPLAAFLLLVLATSERWSPLPSLAGGTAVWLLVAAVVQRLH